MGSSYRYDGVLIVAVVTYKNYITKPTQLHYTYDPHSLSSPPLFRSPPFHPPHPPIRLKLIEFTGTSFTRSQNRTWSIWNRLNNVSLSFFLSSRFFFFFGSFFGSFLLLFSHLPYRVSEFDHAAELVRSAISIPSCRYAVKKNNLKKDEKNDKNEKTEKTERNEKTEKTEECEKKRKL